MIHKMEISGISNMSGELLRWRSFPFEVILPQSSLSRGKERNVSNRQESLLVQSWIEGLSCQWHPLRSSSTMRTVLL